MIKGATEPGSRWRDRGAWEAVQAELAPIEGDEGVRRRAEEYAPFFQHFGERVRILPNCYFSSPWRIVLENGAGINRGAIIEGSSGIRIGRNCRIGHRVLIHSANHLIEDEDGLAFFERGYAYLPVVIGDNALISANVTILPGARIGPGSFVAAGAVVTAGDWPEASRLMGVPARARDGRGPAPVPPPLVVLRAPGEWLASARRLVAALGLPQVRAQAAAEPLLGGTKAVIDLTEDAAPPSSGLIRWHLAPADSLTQDIARHGQWPALPREVRRTRVRNGFGEAPSLASCAAATLYSAWNHRNKQPAIDRLSAGEQLRWLVLPLLRDVAPAALHAGWDRLITSLAPVGPNEAENGATLGTQPDRYTSDRADLDARAAERAAGLAPAVARAFSEPEAVKPAVVRSALLSAPELLPPLVARLAQSHRAYCEALLDLLLPHASTAERLAAVGIAALLLGQADRAEAVVARLTSRDWCVDGGSAVLSARGSRAVSRSALVGGCLAAAALSRTPDADLAIREVVTVPLTWHAVTTSGDIVDQHRRLISPSLFTNWRALVEAPAIEQGHILIDDLHFADAAGELEAIWAEIAVAAIRAAGHTAVRVHPWPSGCRWALALRLDVDRAVPARTINAVLDVQRQRMRAAAGSWYFIPGAAHNGAVRGVLKYWNQEYGLHATAAGQEECDVAAVLDTGVTMHSSNRSEYWRGRPTLDGARQTGARYAESMLSMHRLPQLDDSGHGPRPLWLTPLHFPLEGSTSDTDTSYFWRRASAIRRQIARGGFVIIGSHPDCDPLVLDRALAEIGLEGAWCATVGDVVARVARLQGPDALAVSEAAGTVVLIPRHCIADVTVETLRPDQNVWRAWHIQLQAGAPRALRLEEPSTPSARTHGSEEHGENDGGKTAPAQSPR